MADTEITLTERAESILKQCQMKQVHHPGHDWGVRPVPRGPQPLLVYGGGSPRGVDDGYDFLAWAETFGFYAEDQLGDCPFVVVTIEPAPAQLPVAVLAYVEGSTTLTIWASLDSARISLPVAYPPIGDEVH
jgi:hypothetical protein